MLLPSPVHQETEESKNLNRSWRLGELPGAVPGVEEEAGFLEQIRGLMCWKKQV